MPPFRERLERVKRAVFGFGTAGLSEAEARRMHTCTIGVICLVGVGPSFTLLTMYYHMSFFSRAVQVTYLVNPIALAPYVIVAGLGYRDAARVVYAIGVNLIVPTYTLLFSVDAGLYLYAPALGLTPFFIFGPHERKRQVFFVALPAVVFVLSAIWGQIPWPGFELVPEVLARLWNLNFLTSFLISVFLFAYLVSVVRKGEERMARFSSAVSEFLDGGLVERLREGADLSPRLRYLTVFFSDLIGSTRTSFEMGNDAFGRMIDEYVREMQAIIEEQGAYIEDVSGDGILGYAGNFESRGRKQDAAAVVSICVLMRARLAELAPRFRELYGLPGDLNVRIGISSGEATVGRTAGARAIYTANGDIVNLGAKLEKKVADLSATGGILISQATADLVGDDFNLARHRVDVEGRKIEAFLVQDSVP